MISAAGEPTPAAKAEALLARWKGIPQVLSAPVEQIAAEAGRSVAELIVTIHLLTLDLLRSRIEDRPLVRTAGALCDYLRARLGHDTHESLWCLYLDAGRRLICDQKVGGGSVARVSFSPNYVLRRALETGATSLILAHNHPSGELAPSRADLDATRSLVTAAAILDISIDDHIIVSTLGWFSMRAEGYM